uniref:RRM domain-containing protein n=1 Tax=Lactuca sativa TaxID=4236 RepID=A0A9R1VYN8_LACSA|nr:hypothetical protein LSAT_V11C400178170 [Lactuca sativa]
MCSHFRFKGFNFPIDFYPKPRSKSRFLDWSLQFVTNTLDWSQQLTQETEPVHEEDATNEEEEEEAESYSEPPEEAKLFVGNLPYDFDSEKLANLFNSVGVVDITEVIYNRDTEQSRGFGFVTMSTVEEADKVVEKFNGYDLSGRALTVNKAAPRGSQPEKRVVGTSFKIYVGNLPWQFFHESIKINSISHKLNALPYIQLKFQDFDFCSNASMVDICEIPILLEWNHEFQFCWNGIMNSNSVAIIEVDA